jgi:GGDEF domain-containing protein
LLKYIKKGFLILKSSRFSLIGVIVIVTLLLGGWLYVDFVEDSKRVLEISNNGFDFFIYKWLTITLITIMIIAVIVGNYIHEKNDKQRMYYKNIIDSSSNIVVVVDKNSIIEVNKTFFKYFNKYSTLEEFKKEHKSISGFFVEKDGYVHKNMGGVNWIEYVMQNPKDNQIKILIGSNLYYFTVGISLISPKDGHYSAIFSDITKEKLYQKELEHTNITDPLTKIRNRYYYNQQIKQGSSNANHYFYPLSLIVFDIDYFKKINDSYGHDIGDDVLVEYTKLISSHLRDGDIFCRIGGEEFTLILPYTDRASAYKVAEKLRVAVKEHKKIVPITMSFGVVEYAKGEDLEFLFKRADEALYDAKEGGRDKVMVR